MDFVGDNCGVIITFGASLLTNILVKMARKRRFESKTVRINDIFSSFDIIILEITSKLVNIEQFHGKRLAPLVTTVFI